MATTPTQRDIQEGRVYRIAVDDHRFFAKGSLVRVTHQGYQARTGRDSFVSVELVLGALTECGRDVVRDRRDETMYTVVWTIYARSLADISDLEEPYD